MFSLSKKQIFALFFVLVLVTVAYGVFSRLTKKPPEVVTTPVVEKEAVKPAKNEIIGRSVEGRVIESYTYGTGSKHLMFVGGIHGGYEWNSVMLAYMFIDYLDAHPEIIPKSLTIQVIPSMNPDGVFKVTNKTGRFTIANVSTDKTILASGRFNANNVDLNRNFDCKWQPKSTWQNKTVSAGTSAFSEPESSAMKSFLLKNNPMAVVFWHSQSNGVYASKCKDGILPDTLNLMNTYSKASGYPAMKTFDAYVTTGAIEDWLASINIPAVTVELKTHEDVEWERNLAGSKAIIENYGK